MWMEIRSGFVQKGGSTYVFQFVLLRYEDPYSISFPSSSLSSCSHWWNPRRRGSRGAGVHQAWEEGHAARRQSQFYILIAIGTFLFGRFVILIQDISNSIQTRGWRHVYQALLHSPFAFIMTCPRASPGRSQDRTNRVRLSQSGALPHFPLCDLPTQYRPSNYSYNYDLTFISYSGVG
jgi:hypothetical protein